MRRERDVIMKWLRIVGEIDGGIFMLATAWSIHDPSHTQLAMCLAAMAAGLGYGLNAIARLYNEAPVVKLPDAADPGVKS